MSLPRLIIKFLYNRSAPITITTSELRNALNTAFGGSVIGTITRITPHVFSMDIIRSSDIFDDLLDKIHRDKSWPVIYDDAGHYCFLELEDIELTAAQLLETQTFERRKRMLGRELDKSATTEDLPTKLDEEHEEKYQKHLKVLRSCRDKCASEPSIVNYERLTQDMAAILA
jgi:hypothetical protein